MVTHTDSEQLDMLGRQDLQISVTAQRTGWVTWNLNFRQGVFLDYLGFLDLLEQVKGLS